MPTFTAPLRKAIPGPLLLVLILLGLSVFINYVDRGNLSIAAPMLKDELRISASQLGILLSAFFWTYACLNPSPAGWWTAGTSTGYSPAASFSGRPLQPPRASYTRSRCCSYCDCSSVSANPSPFPPTQRSLR